MPRLGVNIDHVATLREARGGVSYPDPVLAAGWIELAGAHGIVVHLREDRRHIQDRDLRLLKETVKIGLNLEMAATDKMVDIASQIKPSKVTLVPERREERTTEGGLDVVGNKKHIAEVIAKLNASGIPVSLFIEADLEQVDCSKLLGAEAIELHTGIYADAKEVENTIGQDKEFTRLKKAAKLARDYDLIVHVGHGLHYHNITPIVKEIKGIDEFNIGHAIIAHAVFIGLEKAVKKMLALIAG